MYSNRLRRFAAALSVALVLVAFLTATHALAAQTSVGNAINYSRSGLKIDGNLLDDNYDLRFKLFTEAEAGTEVGVLIEKNNVSIDKGVLRPTVLNFGADVFTGETLFLEVKARKGNQSFKLAGPRERLRPVPFALSLPGFCTQQNDTCPNIIGGFAGNSVADGISGATISGGGQLNDENVVFAFFGALGGGLNNSVGGFASVIGGGQSNTTDAQRSTVSGGEGNTASESYSAVGGGLNNTAAGLGSTVAGGGANLASGTHANVGGGANNVASGTASTVPGGDGNVASGLYSFAAGHRAKAGFNGSFVWADSTDADFFAGGVNGFNVRASGGTRIFSNSSLTTGVFLTAGGGSWSSVSDRNLKTNLQEVDTRRLLEQVCAMPITTWNYTSQDDSVRHIGPMAQDFRAAFGVGEDDKHITTIDADGVLFAAVQGLHQIISERDAEIAQQRADLAALTTQLRNLQDAVKQLAAVSSAAKPTQEISNP